jgi:ubiquinone/menaquinone biosynthesis C-methylase UbiE
MREDQMEATRGTGNAQYRDASRYNARVALHARFATNPRPWPAWVFDQFEGRDGCRVLELGCGTGMLWQVNAPRVPASWRLMLTDSSEGMLAESRRRLEGLACRFELRVMDAQEIDFADGSFDLVIANHVLYHLPRRERAMAKVRRVLKEGGAFHATTASLESLAELRGLMQEFKSGTADARVAASTPASPEPAPSVIAAFSLENGATQLREHFEQVETRVYADELRITDPDAIVDYFLSLNEMRAGEQILAEDEVSALRDFIATRMSSDGELRATTESGMFVCR